MPVSRSSRRRTLKFAPCRYEIRPTFYRLYKLTILLGLVDEQAVSENVINNKKDVWITRKFALATMTTMWDFNVNAEPITTPRFFTSLNRETGEIIYCGTKCNVLSQPTITSGATMVNFALTWNLDEGWKSGLMKEWGRGETCVPTFNGNDIDELCLRFQCVVLVYICIADEVKWLRIVD